MLLLWIKLFDFEMHVFLLFPVTLKWDLVTPRLPFLTTFTSIYDFSITPIFRIKKNTKHFGCLFRLSFLFYIYKNPTSVWRLVSAFGSSPCCYADCNCLPKRNNSKNKIGGGRKKVGELSDTFLTVVIKENKLFFFSKCTLQEKSYDGHFANSFTARDCIKWVTYINRYTVN